jgi:hypothetical protein
MFTPLFLILIACTPSEEVIATALAQTSDAQMLRSLAETLTQAAVSTDTPQPSATASETPSPTNTSTPEITLTSTPPPGSMYVPDFIGMNFWQAHDEFLKESEFRWYYVELINKTIPDWQIFGQTPGPGSLIRVNEEKCKFLVGRISITDTPEPPDKGGKKSSDPCGGITYAGICESNVVYWCENETLYYYDCGWCGGVCLWNDAIGFICSCW